MIAARPLAAGIAVLFVVCAPALGKPQPAPAPAPPPPASSAPVAPLGPVMTDDQRAAAFTTWATTLASGNKSAAADELLRIIGDPSLAPVHGEAWGHLGEYYADLGFDLAAIGAMGRGMALDPAHAGPFASKALALVDKVGEAGLVGEALGNNVGIQVDAQVRNALAVTAARYQLEHESYGPALGILMMGQKDLPRFDDVEELRGIVLSQQGQHESAIQPLLTASALGVQNDRDPKWVTTANLNVARAYYATGNYGQAIAYYAKIERDSDWWLDAQFERAWAHFRGNDVNGTLAMLFNHESAFFQDFYYPEADLLRAYALFVMCKFPDASKEMDAFVAKYQPIGQELTGVALSPEEAFADVEAFRNGKDTRLPGYVLRPYRHEQRFTDAIATVDKAEDELGRMKKLEGRQAEIARDLVTSQKDARVRTEGARVLARIGRAKQDLDGMLEGIEITRLDLLALETKMYERAAATGVLDYGNRVDKLKELRRTKKGFRVWPWQDEYWADELGWYVFSARPDCPESMARGEEPGK